MPPPPPPPNDSTPANPTTTTTPSRTKRRDDPTSVARSLLRDYDAVVFDCDGVLWKGDALVTPLVPELLSQLERHGKPCAFFTNNSLQARADYARKFARLGLSGVGADRIFCSSAAAAAWLAQREGQRQQHQGPSKEKEEKKRAYVVGGQGILDELQLAGFGAFGGPEDSGKTVDFKRGAEAEVTVPPDVCAVVVGVDPGLCYYKIHYAAQCLLQRPQCLFVACNEDGRGHFTKNQEWPGAGASVAAVAAVVGRRPDVVVGKPSVFMAREVVARLAEARGLGADAPPPRVLMVGDRLDTDVAWAHAASDALAAADGGDEDGNGDGEEPTEQRRRQLGALLVMSGVATDADLEAWGQGGGSRAPEHVLSDVGELARALAEEAEAAVETQGRVSP